MTDSPTMDAAEIACRLAIAELHGGYAHAIDRGDIEAIADRFTSDGELVVHGGRSYRGRAAILEFLTESRRSRVTSGQGLGVRHHVSSVTLRVSDSEHAAGECYFLAMGRKEPDHWGIYRDSFTVERGLWLYLRREVTIEGADPDGWIGSGAGAVSFDRDE